MQEHRTFISSVQKMDFGPNSTLKAKECRNIEKFAPKNYFWAKFHITSQGMQEHQTFITSFLNIFFWAKFHITSQGLQEHRTFISSLLKIDFRPSSKLQAKECKNIETLSVRSK